MNQLDSQSLPALLLLGAYGNFGTRIAQMVLATHAGRVRLILAGRSVTRATALQDALLSEYPNAVLEVLALDVTQQNPFSETLRRLHPFLTIHTSGPFQRQSDFVPRACIEAGSHYIDLADDRLFIEGVCQLDTLARDKRLCVVTGASSVPGLSSAVINHLTADWQRLLEIDFAIAPGYRAQRGLATVAGIVSTMGQPISIWQHGAWQTVYGWMSARQWDFGTVLGKRWLANVDIPDLALFPHYYAEKGIQSVRFQAGIELGWLHGLMVLMAHLAKWGWVKNWQPFAPLIFKASEWFNGWGTPDGGMQIALQGIQADGQPVSLRWRLVATDGIGPYIPCFSSVILARRWLDGLLNEAGARACLGMFSIEEFEAIAKPLGIYSELDHSKAQPAKEC